MATDRMNPSVGFPVLHPHSWRVIRRTGTALGTDGFMLGAVLCKVIRVIRFIRSGAR
jgi:hypothetical protein